MKLPAVILPLLLLTGTANAADNTCLSNKYHGYIDASLSWYESLVDLTVEKNPTLDGVSQWFLEGRQHHFELSRKAVDYYLEHDPSLISTDKSVESWLNLEQEDIKRLATRSDELGEYAQKTFSDRQSKPHEKNYELRSAFADLLSHPQAIDVPLQAYNNAMEKISAIKCN